MKDFLEELWDEASDFFEDLWEHIAKKEKDTKRASRTVVTDAVTMRVRPAYIFAERIEKVLSMFIGISIISSAVSSTFLGFSSLSDLLKTLIFTFWGRGVMIVIGGSYFLIAFWKLYHLNEKHAT